MKLIAAVVAIATAFSAGMADAEVQLNTQSEIVRFSNRALGRTQQFGYNNYRSSGPYYFSAIAISASKDIYYDFEDASSMAAAQRIAVIGCNYIAQTRDCEVYAGSRPRGGGAATSLGNGPQSLVEEIKSSLSREDLRNLRPDKAGSRGFFAVALSPIGGWGVASYEQAPHVASENALDRCREAQNTLSGNTFLMDIEVGVFRQLRAVPGLLDCKVKYEFSMR